MAKLVLQMNMSADGYVADAERKLDWMVPETDPKHIKLLQKLTQQTGLILLGRTMATESIPHWEEVAQKKSDDPETEFAKFFVETPKLVFSKTLKSINGKNIELISDDLKKTVQHAKGDAKKNLIVYGGAGFVASLLEHSLIDELNLFIHPIALGKGLSIFNHPQKLQLNTSEEYDNGVILHQYVQV